MKVVQHNLKTGYVVFPRWYMAAKSTSERFVFLDAYGYREVVYTAADGWTQEDALSFHNYLMGWEPQCGSA